MNVIQNLNFMKAITELVPKLIQQALWIVVVTTIVGFALAIVIGFLLAFTVLAFSVVKSNLSILLLSESMSSFLLRIQIGAELRIKATQLSQSLTIGNFTLFLSFN